MLSRNWLILVNDDERATLVKAHSSYKTVESLKDLRVSLLSGEYTGVVVLSILDLDVSGFPGFVSSLRNHPELKKIQIIMLDELKPSFSDEDLGVLKFYTLDQISTLIDLDFSFESIQSEELGNDELTSLAIPEDGLSSEIVMEKPQARRMEVREEDLFDIGNLEYLKHICATAIANMVVEGEVDGDRATLLKVLSRRVLQG